MLNTIKLILRILKHGDYRNWNAIKSINEKVLIIGNGPSLKGVDLKSFQNHGIQLCCVNSFAAENEQFFKLRPRYYCAIDPDIYSDKPLDFEGNKKLYSALEKVDWEMTFICHRHQRLPINNDNIKYAYLPTTQCKDLPPSYFFYKHSVAGFGFQNVVNACLYYFITAEAEEILLIGIETDWHKELMVDKNNIVYRKKIHFYGEHLENVTESGIIGKGELYKYFEFYANTLKCFYLSSRYSAEMKTKVINLTLNSYVDCFKKMDPEVYLRGSTIDSSKSN